MSKGLTAAVLTEAAEDRQKIFWCVALGYSTTLRLTNHNKTVTISGNSYSPWPIDVSGLQNSQGFVERVIISATNADLTSTGTHSGLLSNLVVDNDPDGITCVIYRVIISTGGTQYETTWFSGTIVAASGGIDSVSWNGVTANDLAARQGSNLCLRLCRYTNWKDTYCGFSGSRTTQCKRTIDDCRTMVYDPVQTTGSGLDDISSQGDYTGSYAAADYRVRISTAGTPDQFKWSRYTPEGALLTAEGAGVAITGGWQTLSLGVQIKFLATTGHTLNDVFTVRASNARRFGDCAHAPLAGTTITINGRQQVIQRGPVIYRNARRPGSYTYDDPTTTIDPGGLGPLGDTGVIPDPILDLNPFDVPNPFGV